MLVNIVKRNLKLKEQLKQKKAMAKIKFDISKQPHERIPKKTSIGRRPKRSSMNKSKKRSWKKYNSQGK